jgi:hypothetical protein
VFFTEGRNRPSNGGGTFSSVLSFQRVNPWLLTTLVVHLVLQLAHNAALGTQKRRDKSQLCWGESHSSVTHDMDHVDSSVLDWLQALLRQVVLHQ